MCLRISGLSSLCIFLKSLSKTRHSRCDLQDDISREHLHRAAHVNLVKGYK